ncbi:proton-coupled zinc antiporter SLC30A5-like isoform X2 [Rhopilema esculentum]|uniref:proton-coupled zinc antiporter SLC30A5-like isoform X2 n=1 Tax=Rhopilema esculentum TaxID=499914 RepID=UPI0031CEE747
MAQKIDLIQDNSMFHRTRADLGRIERNAGGQSYIYLLMSGKFLNAFGIFLCYGLLKDTSLLQALFFFKAISSCITIVLQRPFTTGKRVSRTQWRALIFTSICNVIITLLWLDALTICGPLRTILLYQQCDAVVLAAVGILFQGGSSFASKIRGVTLFFLGLLFLLFFDHDERHDHDTHREHKSDTFHHLYHFFVWLGLPDHKGGIFILLLVSICKVFYNSHVKKLSVDIGGSKRMNCLLVLTETLLLAPWLIASYFLKDEQFRIPNLFPLVSVAFIVFVVDFYIEAICSAKLESHVSSRISSISSFIAALVIGYFWEHVPYADLMPYEIRKHGIAAGAVLATVCFIAATRILTRPVPVKPGVSKGMFVGYSKGGQPLYSLTGPGGTLPRSPLSVARNFLRQILEAPDSRNIFFYLCLNLMFTGVELVYGVWTNSLGLISDGFHMLFDCSALVLGLVASLMSRWKATKVFSFGYGRVEILSGFVNGLFLVVIAFFVFVAALQRLIDPPTVNTEKLMAVSVAGLLVNMIGIFAFSHAHSHGGAKCDHDAHFGHSHQERHNHNSGHGHSHHGTHGHSHSGHGHSHEGPKKQSKGTTNMQGVYLHVVADTLGSVGVIVSSFFIQQYNWYIADPICSLFIAVLIFLSVIPLLKQSSHVLLLRTPSEVEDTLHEVLAKILSIENVLSYKDQHFWQHSADLVVGTISLQVTPTAIEQRVIQQVTSIVKEYGVGNLTVQIEKESFYHNLNKLSGDGLPVMNFQKQTTLDKYEIVNIVKSV